MATKIRLQRHGRLKRPFYRMVVTDGDNPRDGRFIELLGTMNPLVPGDEVNIKEERIKYWLGVGATPSDRVVRILDKVIPGYISELETTRKEKIRSKRAARRAKVKARK